MANNLNTYGVTGAAPPSHDSMIALCFVAMLGGAAPFLLRLGAQLVGDIGNPDPGAMPPAGVWVGILIFALIGLVVAYAFAERNAKQYLMASMMAPAIITNAMVGIENAGGSEPAENAERSGWFLGSTAYATEHPQGAGGAVLRDVKTIVIKVDLDGAAHLSRPAQIRIDVPTTDGVGTRTEICPVAEGSRCEISVPQAVESLELQVGVISQTVGLPPGDAQIAVEVRAVPNLGQQTWWAMGGRLRGEMKSFETQVMPLQSR